MTVEEASQETLPRRGVPVVLGTQLGRYVVLDTLGSGAMGQVLSAYDPELDRRVALKLLRSDLAQTEEARTRLMREARALAKLAHPNVVTVHDVGVVETTPSRGSNLAEPRPSQDESVSAGTVFVAMEFVHGGNLAQWLAAESRNWRDVVSLFRQAGEGLAAAHAAGLLHRDFKPSNVLVGDDGRVRVADFGLARPATAEASALQQSVLGANLRSREPDDADSAWLTATGSLLGTPAYMPPEQLAGGEIDARADQFAFCSALFEALYDRLPFGGPASARAADILAGRFREPRRGTKAPRWVHRAVLRGLAGDPAERWPSMRDLLDQLARNPRRRQLTTLAMVFLGATATVATLRPWHADPCVGAADALDALWSPQEKERLSGSFEASSLPYSEQLWQQTQKSLDRWAESWRSMRVETCEATWLRGEQSPRRLDLRTDCLNQHLGDFEALVDLLADGTPGMLEHAPAAASRLESVADCANTEELETALPLPDDADARAGIAELRSRVDRVRQLRRLGQFKESWRRAQDLLASPAVDWQESTDEQGLVDTPSTRLKYPPALAEVLIEAGTSARTVEEPDVAHDYLFAAVLESDKGSVDSDRAWALLALADLHIHEPDRAQPWLDLASAAGRRIDDPALLVQRLIVEARLQRTKGRLEPALRAARQAVEVAEESQGGVGRATEAQARRLVLLLLRLLGERTGILEQIEALLADQRAIYGDGHPQVLSLMLDRGEALLAVGRAPEATEVFRRAAQRAASTLGRSSYAYAVTLESLSGGYLGQGDLENAEQKAREAIAIYDLQGDAAFERQTGSRHNLAAVLWSAGRLDEAESLFTNVLAQRDARYERPHVRLIPVETMLGRLRMEKGELKSALELLSSARRQALVVYPTENTKSLHAGLAYGMALIEAGRASQGAQLIDSLAPLVPSEGSEPWIRALALWSHATAAASRGDRAEALELAQDARRLYLTMRGEGRRQRERIDRWIAAGLETPMNEPWS